MYGRGGTCGVRGRMAEERQPLARGAGQPGDWSVVGAIAGGEGGVDVRDEVFCWLEADWWAASARRARSSSQKPFGSPLRPRECSCDRFAGCGRHTASPTPEAAAHPAATEPCRSPPRTAPSTGRPPSHAPQTLGEQPGDLFVALTGDNTSPARRRPPAWPAAADYAVAPVPSGPAHRPQGTSETPESTPRSRRDPTIADPQS